MKKILITICTIGLFSLCFVLLLGNKTEAKIDINNVPLFNFNNNIGFSESKITEQTISRNQEQELTDLFGTPVTNKLGIPDIYLNIVSNNIPESHEQARLAAIKMYYFDSLALQALSKKDYKLFIKNNYRWSAGIDCFFFYESNNQQIKYGLIDLIENITSNIPKLKRLNQQADNNLGGHIIHNDYGLVYENNNYEGINDAYSSKYSDRYICEYYLNHQF